LYYLVKNTLVTRANAATVYPRGSARDERGGVVVADAPPIPALVAGDDAGRSAALFACVLVREVHERRQR